MAAEVAYEAFRDEWLSEVLTGSPSTTEKGNRFARKLVTQWLDVGDSSDDLVYCDGAGDGGIDVAYLHRAEAGDGEGEVQGDTWYLIQSKYGSAFAGTETLLAEGQKVIDTLDGQRKSLSSVAADVLERLTQFRKQASELDRIVLVFGTVETLNEAERRVMHDLTAMGRQRLGPLFDVEAVCVETLYRKAQDDAASASVTRLTLKASLSASGPELLVGVVSLLDLYDFLKAYKTRTGDIDELYEKNVRRFLGSRGKVNKAMRSTLKETPDRFGLYNNGITVVVTDFKPGDKFVELFDPYVVNGCQTTRTIWEVFHQKLEAGGKGKDPELEDWKSRAGSGVVVTKVVKVGAAGEALLQEITRFTNSQNAVRDKDFIALQKDFRSWEKLVASKWNIFLEVQRGAWDSQRARQKQNPSGPQYKEWANAFDLLKVYASGWLGEAGTAFGKNAAFAPNGSIFKRVIDTPNEADAFGVDDLYAAYKLDRAADGYHFGRGGQPSRRQTRYLFFMVTIELLKGLLLLENRGISRGELTTALLTLFKPGNEDAASALLDAAVNVIDEYMNPGMEDSIYKEPGFNNDLNTFLKSESLGSDKTHPRYKDLTTMTRRGMTQKVGKNPSVRDVIMAAIKSAS